MTWKCFTQLERIDGALLRHMASPRHSRQAGDPVQRLRLSARETQLVDDIVSILHSVAAFACFDGDDAPAAWESSSVASSDSDSSFKTARSSHDEHEQRASGLEALLMRMRAQVDAQQPSSARPPPRRRRGDAVGSHPPREAPRRVESRREASPWPAARQAARMSTVPAAPERYEEEPTIAPVHQASPSVAPRFPAALLRRRQQGRW